MCLKHIGERSEPLYILLLSVNNYLRQLMGLASLARDPSKKHGFIHFVNSLNKSVKHFMPLDNFESIHPVFYTIHHPLYSIHIPSIRILSVETAPISIHLL